MRPPVRMHAIVSPQLALGGGKVLAPVAVGVIRPLTELPMGSPATARRTEQPAPEGLARTVADYDLPDDGVPRVTSAEHAVGQRAFDAELHRIRREGDTEALARIVARQAAAGYGGPVDVDGGGVMIHEQPGPLAPGPRVRCSCGSEMLSAQFEEHASLYARALESVRWSGPLAPLPWTLHGQRLVDNAVPAGTEPSITAELPALAEAPPASELLATEPASELLATEGAAA